jgi:cation transport protein ChaC
MWNPGFAVRETQAARLHGFHRAFCIYSEHYRGTPEKPGLILGLLASGSCRGLAHRLPVKDYDRVRRYLWTREIENDGVYVEETRPIHLADGRTVQSLVYLADRAHRQFAGKLPLAKALKLVRKARAQPAPISIMSATRSRTYANSACAIETSKSWRRRRALNARRRSP